MHKKCKQNLVCLSTEESGKSKLFLPFFWPLFSHCFDKVHASFSSSYPVQLSPSHCCPLTPPCTPASSFLPNLTTQRVFNSLSPQKTDSAKKKKIAFLLNILFRGQASVPVKGWEGMGWNKPGFTHRAGWDRESISRAWSWPFSPVSHWDGRPLSSDTGCSFCHHCLQSCCNNIVLYFFQ